MGATDTDICAGYDGDKIDPADVSRAALSGLADGQIEIIDDWSAMIKDTLSANPRLFYVPTLTSH